MVIDLLVFGLFAIVALSLGNLALSAFSLQFAESGEELVFSYAIGLIFLAYLVLGLGIAGVLDATGLWFGLAVFTGISFVRMRRVMGLLFTKRPSGSVFPWLPLLFWGLIALIGWNALVPPFNADSLAYHLSTPKSFLRIGAVDRILDDSNSLFPFFTEMLFTLGLLARNEVLAQLFSWSIGTLLALALMFFFSRFFGSKTWGWIIAIFFLLTPGIFNQMKEALVDVSWSTYNFLGFYGLMVGISQDKKGWLWIAFILLGITLGVKYLAGLTMVGIVLAMILFAVQLGWKYARLSSSLLVMGLVALLVSGYWYFKTYAVHGNPVYPYFNPLFGLPRVMFETAVPGDYSDVGIGTSFKSLLLFPFHLTFNPTRFDGWGEQIGPFYLAFLPFIFWSLRLGVCRPMMTFVVVVTGALFWFGQVTRFLYPVLPFLVLMIGAGMVRVQKEQPRVFRFHRILLVLVFVIQLAVMLYYSRHALAYMASPGGREPFLIKNERSYAIATFVNSNVSRDAKILNAEEPRTYYFDREMVREVQYRRRTQFDMHHDLSKAISRLARDGFTHILDVDMDPNWEKYGIRKLIADAPDVEQYLIRSHEITFKESDGRKIAYVLYEIK